MAQPIDEVAMLTKHLLERPIAPIFENCSEKNNLTALRFMFIVDYHTLKLNLYVRIDKSSHPKLLTQLLKFDQFETFKYYDYRMNSKIGRRVLQCKYCELIGPLDCILTHMIINHSVHTGQKQCVFCDDVEFKTHIANNTLDRCYDNYIHRQRIEINRIVYKITDDFYKMLKTLSEKLSISTVRNQCYAARGYASREKLPFKYGNDFPTECTVFSMRTKTKNRSIQSRALNEEFERIRTILYPRNFPSRPMRQQPCDNNVIVIESDDDFEDMEHFASQSHSEPHDTENKHGFPVSLTIIEL